MKRELRLFDEIDRFAADGPIIHAMALSYGYDGDIANDRIWRPLVERFGVRHPLVIADADSLQAGTALGVHVLRIRRGRSVFHPKLLLAVREDAVLVTVGSANLTRGGLGGNLELMTVLTFSKDDERSASPDVLDAVIAFLEKHVLTGLVGRVAPSSLDVAGDILHHCKLVRDVIAPTRESGVRFLHSGEEALWPQLRRVHGDDPVEHLAVVSPFFEADDPEAGEADSLLKYALSAEGLPWTKRSRTPRCTLYVAPVGPGLLLPTSALKALGDEVALRTQRLSVEPRRLHAKLIAVVGAARVTLLWGSPNFTPSALMRPATAGGNVECALAISTERRRNIWERLRSDLGLDEVFDVHTGALPEPVLRPTIEAPWFEVGEALYDPAVRSLEVHGEFFRAGARRVVAESDELLLEMFEPQVGPFSMSGPAPGLEEIDPDTGQRQLRTLEIRIRALGEHDVELAAVRVRLNVKFEDALEVRQNLLLGANVLSPDALLVPSSAPPERRVALIDARIAAWRAERDGSSVPRFEHHASLDLMFRNVRGGLDARWEGLVARRGSRFALLRWSHDLRRALKAVLAEVWEPARKLYLVTRVSEHVERVLDEIPRWHATAEKAACAVMEPARLAEDLAALSLDVTGLTPAMVLEARSVRDRVVARLRGLP